MKKMVVGLEARSDSLALLRPVAKPVLLLRKPEFHFKLFTASQAQDLVSEPKERLPSSLQLGSCSAVVG